MASKKAKTRYTLDEVRELIKHNTHTYKEEDGFADFIVELTTYLYSQLNQAPDISSDVEDSSSKRVPIPHIDHRSSQEPPESVMELPPTVKQLQRRSSGSIDLVSVAGFRKVPDPVEGSSQTLPKDNVLEPPPSMFGRRDPKLPPPREAPLTAPVISESFIDSDSTRKNVLPPSITSRSTDDISVRASRTPTGLKRPPGSPPPKPPASEPSPRTAPPAAEAKPAPPAQERRISPPPPGRNSMSGEINLEGLRPTGARTRVYKVTKTSSTVAEISCWNCAQMYNAAEQCCPSCGAKKRK